jgi:hypothetical protein
MTGPGTARNGHTWGQARGPVHISPAGAVGAATLATGLPRLLAGTRPPLAERLRYGQ